MLKRETDDSRKIDNYEGNAKIRTTWHLQRNLTLTKEADVSRRYLYTRNNLEITNLLVFVKESKAEEEN